MLSYSFSKPINFKNKRNEDIAMAKKNSAGMNYVITGHKGLIASFLKKRLDGEGHECVMQIDSREGFDVQDLLFKDYRPKSQVDVFLHFASQCRINEGIAKPILPHKHNTDGIFSVLEFCRQHKIPRIVVASSSRVLSPEMNPYTASKIYSEVLTRAYHDCYGLDYLIIRPSTVYGPMFDETSRLINNFLTSAFKNEDLGIYGDEDKTLDFTFIDDFVDGVMLAMDNGWNKAYNISGKDSVKLYDIAKYIIGKLNSKSEIKFFPPELAQPQQVKVDIHEIEQIGYKPKVNIWDGIDRMIEFYRASPKAWKNYVDRGREYYKEDLE